MDSQWPPGIANHGKNCAFCSNELTYLGDYVGGMCACPVCYGKAINNPQQLVNMVKVARVIELLEDNEPDYGPETTWPEYDDDIAHSGPTRSNVIVSEIEAAETFFDKLK